MTSGRVRARRLGAIIVLMIAAWQCLPIGSGSPANSPRPLADSAVAQAQAAPTLDAESWFPIVDPFGTGSAAVFSGVDCGAQALASGDVLPIPGCGQISGKVAPEGFVGLARKLEGSSTGRIAPSDFIAISFFARGDGKAYRLRIESEEVARNGNFDYHEFAFTAPLRERQVVVPLDQFLQRESNPAKRIDLRATEIKALLFVTDGYPYDFVSLAIRGISFLRVAPNPQTRLEATGGPLTVRASLTGGGLVTSGRVRYSLDRGKSYLTQPLSGSGLAYQAVIPGPADGGEIRYYLELTDQFGNQQTDPADAPGATYRFLAAPGDTLLLDDFDDTNFPSALGRISYVYKSAHEGAMLAYLEKGALRLNYNVFDAGAFGGYVTSLRGIERNRYDALVFSVRGSVGSERIRIGLRDSAGNEPKLLIGKFLPYGLTPEWGQVIIPLVAFTSIGQNAVLENLSFTAEQLAGAGKGEIVVDNLRFVRMERYAIPIDGYNDGTAENALAGDYWTVKGGTGAITATVVAGETSLARRISVSGIDATSWAEATTGLKGLDASKTRSIRFWMRSELVTWEVPTHPPFLSLFRPRLAKANVPSPHLYLFDQREQRKSVDIAQFGPVDGKWRRYEIPLSAFAEQGIDLSRLVSLSFTFEWMPMSGSIDLDDLQFVGSDVHRVFLAASLDRH